MLPLVIVIFEGSVMSMTVEGAMLKVVPFMEMLCYCGVEGGGVVGGGVESGGVESGGSGGAFLVIGGGVMLSISSISKSGRSLGVMRVWKVSGTAGARAFGASGGCGWGIHAEGEGSGVCFLFVVVVLVGMMAVAWSRLGCG